MRVLVSKNTRNAFWFIFQHERPSQNNCQLLIGLNGIKIDIIPIYNPDRLKAAATRK